MRYLLALVVVFIVAYAADGTGATEIDAKTVVLVTGATGRQGGAVARELLQRGYRVRGLTRNPDSVRARALVELGIDVIGGDFGDTESLIRAMRGADGVFAVTDFWEHGFQGEIQHGQNLVDAAARANVTFFVYSSVASANRNTDIPHFDSKYQVEQYLKSSGLDYAVIRPVSFMENWTLDDAQSGEIITAGSATRPHQYISVQDIAYFVANAFDSPTYWNGVAIDVASDELSLVEISRLLSEIARHDVVLKRISWEEYESRFGEEIRIMSQWFENVGYEADVELLRRQHPNLKTMERYLRELAGDTPNCSPGCSAN